MMPKVEMRRLRRVNLAEKMMKGSSVFSFFSPSSSSSSSFPSSSVELPLHHFVLEAKVKWVKVGKSRMEGWAMTVLSMLRCQQETRPSRKPGRNIVAKIVASTGTLCSAGTIPSGNGEDSASPFPPRERREVTKMSRNLGATEGQRYQNLARLTLEQLRATKDFKYEN